MTNRHPTHAAPSLNRRRMLRFAGVAGLAVAAGGVSRVRAGAAAGRWAAQSTTAAPSLGTLRIGYLPITDASPLLIAHAKGSFAARGIDAPDPVLFRSWAAIAEAFQSNQVDVVHLLMPLAVQLRFGAKQPIKVVAWNHTNGSALTVGPAIATAADLAGQNVAIPFWHSIHNVVVQQILRANGLTAVTDGDPNAADRTVKLVVMPPSDMPPALSSGSIAGFIVADPFNALAESSGVGRILRFTGDVWRDHACCVTVVKEDLVSGRADAAQAVVDALAEAQLALRTDRVGSAKLLSEGGYLPQPLPAIERALTHYDVAEYGSTGAIQHEGWGSQRIDFQPFPFPSYTARLIEELRTTTVDGDATFLDEIDLTTAHADLVATGLAERAIERAGGEAAFGLPGLSREETIAP